MFPFPKTLCALLVGATSASAQFGAPNTVPVGPSPEGSTLADFDGDGRLDLAIAVDAPDRVQVLPGDGLGGFGAAQSVFTGPGSSPHTPVAVDADGDGDLDIAVTLNNQNSVRVLLNSGGVFSLGASAPTGGDPRQLIAAQLDGSGPDDLICVGRDSSTVSVLLADGLGGYNSATQGVGADPRGVAVADLDGDGDLDVVVSANDVRRLDLLLNNGAGALTAAGNLSLGAQLRPEGVVAADLDGDGDADLASAASGNGLNVVAVFLQGPAGFGGFSSTASGGVDPSHLALADVDIDGDLDVLVSNTDSNNLATLSNDGAGGFANTGSLGVGSEPGRVSVGDLDGNGGVDAVVTNEAGASVSVLLNTQSASPFVDLGQGLAGSTAPSLSATGTLETGSSVSFLLSDALPGSSAAFVLGLSVIAAPFKGGVMVPDVDLLLVGLPVSPAGTLAIVETVPALPPGTQITVQEWITDAGGPAGFAATNAVQGTTP